MSNFILKKIFKVVMFKKVKGSELGKSKFKTCLITRISASNTVVLTYNIHRDAQDF